MSGGQPGFVTACASLALAATPGCPALAQSVGANGGLTQPVEVIGEADLQFGVVTTPREGTCDYLVPAVGDASASGGQSCQMISGARAPAGFTINCAANAPIQVEAIFTNAAPDGATFSAPANPLAIDALAPGPVLQSVPCDSDGQSKARIGGTLKVTAAAPTSYAGVVGQIRLEVRYE